MSYFDFYSKNISKPADAIEISTSPQHVLSAKTVSRPNETIDSSVTSVSPQDVILANDISRLSKKNNGSRCAESVLPTQKCTEENKTTSIKTCESSEFVKGSCLAMCPEDEVLMREKAKMVHILEVIDGKKVLVKCYSRSAADLKVAVPQLLRPYEVLHETVQHLLLLVTQIKDTRANVVYDFVSDRLRAVRQDMTVQRLPPTQCISLLEPMIRFHVYFGYILCEYPMKQYDPVLNKKLFLECLKWFLSCCDSIDQSPSPEDLNSYMSHLNINHNLASENSQTQSFRKDDEENTKCDQVLMESLYILSNLDDVHPIYRYWNLTKNLRSHPSIKIAYKIAVANLRCNYVQVCKHLENLCPLTYCALCLYLPKLQRRALLAMSAAYNSRRLAVPLGALRRWLRLAEAARVCAHYGLRAAGEELRFARADFRADVPTHQPTRLILLDQKMDLSIKHVFTYLSKDYTYGV